MHKQQYAILNCQILKYWNQTICIRIYDVLVIILKPFDDISAPPARDYDLDIVTVVAALHKAI